MAEIKKFCAKAAFNKRNKVRSIRNAGKNPQNSELTVKEQLRKQNFAHHCYHPIKWDSLPSAFSTKIPLILCTG